MLLVALVHFLTFKFDFKTCEQLFNIAFQSITFSNPYHKKKTFFLSSSKPDIISFEIDTVSVSYLFSLYHVKKQL